MHLKNSMLSGFVASQPVQDSNSSYRGRATDLSYCQYDQAGCNQITGACMLGVATLLRPVLVLSSVSIWFVDVEHKTIRKLFFFKNLRLQPSTINLRQVTVHPECLQSSNTKFQCARLHACMLFDSNELSPPQISSEVNAIGFVSGMQGTSDQRAKW